ncbi:sensor histidine kinase [Listeria riparia]|uniref:histidine kinase n=1 Tax=Listeria riparia FSL S10-1204 TaxID=1265816 RepID=W7DJ84_9LIST|nr:sensor histidine kinase [Listeria riparia]EUJ45428.1 integral membrane sensor signal transduction histidine kinase [Listeria riparia FSL S10-1204]
MQMMMEMIGLRRYFWQGLLTFAPLFLIIPLIGERSFAEIGVIFGFVVFFWACLWLPRRYFEIRYLLPLAVVLFAGSGLAILYVPGVFGYASIGYWALIVLLGRASNRDFKWSLGTTIVAVCWYLILSRSEPGLVGVLSAVGMLAVFSSANLRAKRNEDFVRIQEAYAKLQELHAELQVAQEEAMKYAALTERNRLAHDIHDGIGHRLTSMIVQLQMLVKMIPVDTAKAVKTTENLIDVAKTGLQETRHLVHSWAPPDGLGMQAIRGLVYETEQQTPLRVVLEEGGTVSGDWPSGLDVAVYRMVQEAITNTLKHGLQATEIVIRIVQESGRVMVQIRDNGKLDGKVENKIGFGLRAMTERVEALGGVIRFRMRDGFVIDAEIPIEKGAGEV